MRITVLFNIFVTLVVLVVELVSDRTPPWKETNEFLSLVFPDAGLPLAVANFAAQLLRLTVYTFLLRALWNRLLPRLGGWNPIRLSEAYALSILGSLL